MGSTREGLPRTEREVVDILLKHLSAFSAGRSLCEVRSHGSSRVDIVIFTNQELIGIEVKRRDWRRGIAQAALNRYCVDKSYVALWGDRIGHSLIEEAKQWGLGVISVARDSIEVLLQAPLADPEPVLRDYILEKFGRSSE